MPWYSAQESLDALLTGRRIGMFHLVCYLRDGDRVFETYWTNGRGAEAMDSSYALMDIPHGRQEAWEDSPAGWPRRRPGYQLSHQRTSHRPMVPSPSRTHRRSRHHRPATRIRPGASEWPASTA